MVKAIPTRRSEKLQSIPGVGPRLAQAMEEVGYHHVSQLRDADPERMYEKLCARRGEHIDRCVLYVFRCAVYYARHSVHDPQRLKWWMWKDTKAAKHLRRQLPSGS
jgi:hypothetical protein